MSMQTHAHMRTHVATCSDVSRLHLLKHTPLSLLYTCIMKKNDLIPPQFSLNLIVK